jgi:solute carrier family 25 citrate transporter 1
MLQRSFAGACGGVTEAVFAVTPVETLKTRVTDDVRRGTKNYTGSLDAAMKIIKSEGPIGLYRGMVPTIMKQGTNQAVRFPVQFYFLQMMVGRLLFRIEAGQFARIDMSSSPRCRAAAK